MSRSLAVRALLLAAALAAAPPAGAQVMGLGLGLPFLHRVPALAALTISPSSASVGTPYSGTIAGQTAGSTLSLSLNPGGAFSLMGTTLSGTPASTTSPQVTETLSGFSNSPRVTTLLTITSGSNPGQLDLSNPDSYTGLIAAAL
jgi:hypothetical protein